MSLTQRLFGAGGQDGTAPADVAVDLPLEVVYDLISCWRRRELLRQVHARDRADGILMADLCRAVAQEEYGKDAEELLQDEINRVKTSTYQNHIPKLHEAGALKRNEENGRVYATEQTAELVHFYEVDRRMIAEGRANE